MLQDRRSSFANDRVSVKASLVPDGEVSAPRVGAELAVARERLGRTLTEMSRFLRIRSPYLDALEQGRIDLLPGRAYALAFLRTYAGALGLDADEAVRRFKAEAAEIGDRTALDFPAPLPERGLPAGALVLLGLVLAVGAYAGWYRLSGDGRLPAETVQPVPTRLAQLTAPAASPQASSPQASSSQASSAQASSAQASSAQASSAQASSARTSSAQAPSLPGATSGASAAASTSPAAPLPAAGATVGMANGSTGGRSGSGPPVGAAAGRMADGTLAPAPVAPQGGPRPAGVAGPGQELAAAPPAAPAPVPDVAPGSAAAATPTPAQDAALQASGPAGASRLLVLATADAWVQVRSGTGAVMFSHLLHAGQSWQVPPGQDLTLTTGNAGGTELVRNGVASAPLGAPGGVLHNVPLGPSDAATTPPAAAAPGAR